jgi:hypothetical protein
MVTELNTTEARQVTKRPRALIWVLVRRTCPCGWLDQPSLGRMMRHLSFEITAPLPKLKAYIASVRPYRVGYGCRRAYNHCD